MVDVVVCVDDFVVGFDAGKVDGVAVRSIPVSRSDFESGSGREVKHGLDNAFAKSGFADNSGFVVVFESASDNFRGRSRVAIDEDNGLEIGEESFVSERVGDVVYGGKLALLDENFVAVEPKGEEIASGADVAATVAAEVENEFLGALV